MAVCTTAPTVGCTDCGLQHTLGELGDGRRAMVGNGGHLPE